MRAMDGLLIEDFASFVELHGGRAAFGKRSLVDVYYAFIKPAVLESGKSYRSILRAKRPIEWSASECLVVLYHWDMTFEAFLDALESCPRSCAYWVDFMCIDCAITLGSVREQSRSHQHWATSTRTAVRNASGCAILLQQLAQPSSLHTTPALYVLEAMVSAGKPICFGMTPSVRHSLDQDLSSDSSLAAVQFIAMSPVLRDYESRALPGGEILRDEIVCLGWEEVHRGISEALRAAFLSQRTSSSYALRGAGSCQAARRLRSQLDAALSTIASNLLSADFESRSCELVDLAVKIHGEDHVDTLLSRFIRAATLACCGQWTYAEACARKCFEGRRDLLGARHVDTLAAMSLLGECCHRAGDSATAESILQECLQVQQVVLGMDHADTLQSMFRWGQLLYDRGQYSCAMNTLEDCLCRQQQALGESHPSTLATLLKLAFTHNIQRRFEQAESAFAAYVSLVKDASVRESIETDGDYQCALEHLAHLYSAQARFALARPLYEERLQLAIVQHGPTHPVTLEHQNCFANVCARLAQISEARQLYLDCFQKAAGHFGSSHSVTRMYLGNYLATLRTETTKPLAMAASDCQSDFPRVVDEAMLEGISVDEYKMNSDAIIGSATCILQ